MSIKATINDNYFFETKIRFATKINKNQDLPFVFALAFGKQVAKTIARDIRRQLPPLSPRSHELRGGPIGATRCIGGQNK